MQATFNEFVRDAAGNSLLTLPASGDAEGKASLTVAGTQTRVVARVWEVDVEPVALAPANDTTQVLAWKRPPPSGARPSYWITPSSAAECWPDLPALRVGDVERIAPPLRVRWSGNVDRAGFGDTVHGFLAADRIDHELDVRRDRARRLLDACDSGASVEADALIGLSNALHAFVQRRWPGAVWHRELPIRVRVGVGDAARRVNGGIDLLLETENGYVVIDHKTYGNPDPAAVREHAEQYLPQLAAYGSAIDALGGKRVQEYWLHFGVGGVVCEIVCDSACPISPPGCLAAPTHHGAPAMRSRP